MRSTLTIHDGTDQKVRRLAEQQRISYKDAINLILEKGLEALTVAEPAMGYKISGFAAGLRPGIDPTKFNQLADDPDQS